MRFPVLLLALFTVTLRAATPLVVQSRTSFEVTPNWTAVTTGNLLGATEGGLISSWSLSQADAADRFKYTSDWFYDLGRPYTVQGAIATNAADTGTTGLTVIVDVTTAERYVQANLAASQGKLVGGDAFNNNYTTADFSVFDTLKLHNGAADAVIQFMSYSPLRYRIHTGSPSHVGGEINVTAAQTNLWRTWKFDNSAGVTNFTFALYDLDTRELIGEVSIALNGASYPAVADIRISNDSHSAASVSRTNYIDNFMLSTNISDYPLIPWATNVYYVNSAIGNDSNSGRANTAAAAWATIGKAASTLVAGETVHVVAGNYAERVAESTDGTANAPITYVADGAVTVRGFQITGDYIRMVGFRATHTTDLGYAAFDISNARGCEIIDCVTTNTSTVALDFIPAGHFTTIRGGSFSWPGYTNGVLRAASKIMQDGNDSGDGSTNILIEYNTMFETGDYINSSGSNWIARNNRLGNTTTAYNSGLPHEDGWQANAKTWNSLYEANWHGENQTDDSHFFLTQVSAGGFTSSNWTTIFNVSKNSGDALFMEVDTMTRFLMANNTCAFAGHGPSRNTAASAIYFQNNSIGNRIANNIFTNVMTSNAAIASTDTGGEVTIGENLTHPNTAGTVDGDPVFVNYAADDLRIQTTSPAKDVGAALTTANGGGTGTTVTLHGGTTNAYWFYDTFDGLIRGAKVYVGNDNNLEIASRDLAAGTITLTTSITWSDGDAVGYAYRGTAPDLGAYEFGDTLLTSATISSNSAAFPVYTISVVGDYRFAVFYVDGNPQTPIYYGSPLTYTSVGNEVVTAKVYALHAQTTPVVTAGAAAPEVPTIWNVTTLNAGTINVGQ